MRLPSLSGKGWTALPALATLWYLWILEPRALWRNSPPLGGDAGAHFALLDYLGESFTFDFAGGMPLWLNYFPLPFHVAGALGAIVGDGMGMRLVMAGGGPALIWASWALLRSWGLSHRLAAWGTAPGVAMLLTSHHPRPNWFGISAVSASIGQFSYQWAFALCIAATAALCARGSGGRRDAGLAALSGAAIALAALCHIYALPLAGFLWCAAWALPRARNRLWGPPLGLAASAWFLFPLAASLGYSSSGGHIQLGIGSIFPLWLVAILPGVPFGVARLRGTEPRALWAAAAPLLGGLPLYLAGTFAGGGPQLWNGRLLPYIWFPICILAGIGAGALVESIPSLWRGVAPWAAAVAGTLIAAGLLFVNNYSSGMGHLVEGIWGPPGAEETREEAAEASARRAGGGTLLYHGAPWEESGLGSVMHLAPARNRSPRGAPSLYPPPGGGEGEVYLAATIWEQTGLRSPFAEGAEAGLEDMERWAERPLRSAAEAARRYARTGRWAAWLGADLAALSGRGAIVARRAWGGGETLWGSFGAPGSGGSSPGGAGDLRWVQVPPPPREGIFAPHPPASPLSSLLGEPNGYPEAAAEWWERGAGPNPVPVRGPLAGRFRTAEITGRGIDEKGPYIRTGPLPEGPALVPTAWFPGWRVVRGGEGTWAAGPGLTAIYARGGGAALLRWEKGYSYSRPVSWAAAAILGAALLWWAGGALLGRGAPKPESGKG